MSRVDLTARLAGQSKPQAKDTILFDKSLAGFGLRIHPPGRKVRIVQARIEGCSRRIVIARHSEMELAEARRRARDTLARIRAGGNPAEDIPREKRTPTVREFAGEYLRRCDPYWKPSGRKTVCIYLKARILPTFGTMPVNRVGPEDVAAWFDEASRDKPGAANRAFEILRSMMFRAEECGFRERGTNPCVGIKKNPRRDIGEHTITLPDSKTDPRAVPLGQAARAIIDTLPGPRRPDAFLFPINSQRRSPYNIIVCWRAVCADAKLGKLRLHDLRHTAASHAVMSGENPPLVGKLLGHRRHETTAGYAHLAEDHLVEATETVGDIIAKAMNDMKNLPD